MDPDELPIDLPEPPEPGGTVDRLMDATREEIAAHGLNGITTRGVADRAGVNEVTLFRRFGSKAELVTSTLTATIAPFATALVTPTDDVRADLATIAGGFARFVDSNPALVARVLSEMVGDSPMMATVRPIQRRLYTHLRGLMSHHRDAGRLDASADVDVATRAFMGPVVARAILSRIGEVGPFDPDDHVERFLEGWGP